MLLPGVLLQEVLLPGVLLQEVPQQRWFCGSKGSPVGAARLLTGQGGRCLLGRHLLEPEDLQLLVFCMLLFTETQDGSLIGFSFH